MKKNNKLCNKLSITILSSMAVLFTTVQSHAIDLIASSEIPSVGFVDLTFVGGPSFDTWSLSGDSEFFLLQDVNANAVGENTHTVMSIFGANGADLNENSFVVDNMGDVNLANGGVFIDRSEQSLGIGTTAVESALHIKQLDAAILVQDTNLTPENRQLLELENNGGIGMRMHNTNAGTIWDFNNTNAGTFSASKVGTGGYEFEVQGNGRTKVRSFGTIIMDMRSNGNLHIPEGDVIVSGTTLNVPDYVFEHDYKLMPLDELKGFVTKNKHLPNVASEAEIKKSKQVSMAKSHMRHLEKIEELTLYTIQQHEQIRNLDDKNISLQERLASLEKLVTNLAMDLGKFDKGDKVALK